MNKRLSEGLMESKNEYIFAFVGFDDYNDYIQIINIIKNVLKPDICKYSGLTDMYGYFEKDGLQVDVEFNWMIDNCLIFKGERTENNLQKVREWAKIIFDNLMLNK